MEPELRTFLKTLELQDEQINEIYRHEEVDQLLIELQLEERVYKQLDGAAIMVLLNTFGPALVALRIVDWLELSGGIADQNTIQDELQNLALASGEQTLRIRINTRAIGEKLSAGSYRVRYHFHQDTFRDQIVESDIAAFESYLHADLDRATVVVIAGIEFQYKGDVLHILSEEDFNSLEEQAFGLDAGIKRDLRHFYQQNYKHINVPRLRISHITPLHFISLYQPGVAHNRHPRSSQDLEIEARLKELAIHLCLIFTADRTELSENEVPGPSVLTSEYRSVERKSLIAFGTLEDMFPSWESIESLARWTLLGESTGKLLQIFRNVVTRVVRGDDAETNFRTFSQDLDEILEEAKWHLDLFLEDTIDMHFKEVENLRNQVHSASEAIGKKLDTVTNGVIEAFLAAVVLVIGSAIASLLEGNITTQTFLIGLQVYGFYLIFGNILFRMIFVVLWSYILIELEAVEKFRSFAKSLNSEVKVRIESAPYRRRRTQFWITFVVVLFLYIWMAIWIFTSGQGIPQLLQDMGLVAPATPVP